MLKLKKQSAIEIMMMAMTIGSLSPLLANAQSFSVSSEEYVIRVEGLT